MLRDELGGARLWRVYEHPAIPGAAGHDPGAVPEPANPLRDLRRRDHDPDDELDEFAHPVRRGTASICPSASSDASRAGGNLGSPRPTRSTASGPTERPPSTNSPRCARSRTWSPTTGRRPTVRPATRPRHPDEDSAEWKVRLSPRLVVGTTNRALRVRQCLGSRPTDAGSAGHHRVVVGRVVRGRREESQLWIDDVGWW